MYSVATYIVATLFRIVTALFQHCKDVLRSNFSLRLVPCNITLIEEKKGGST